MLQRAASNAYSWWWASNIRTKQSKWLDNDLQEMEEKVKTMVRLIEVDADSFAKKAEMYYQRRPELLGFVEETYRAYKALADRYDRISGDLHKANHTLASAFPDQFQFAMQEDEDDSSPRASIDTSKLRKPPPGQLPQINLRNKTQDSSSTLKKYHKKVSPNISKENVQDEIDKLQKEILVLQTEKEFVKSSYESGLAKFWEIENKITDLQDEACTLQDEFSASSVIEDDEARALMAATAIKSCEESLVSLQHQQKRSNEEAHIESKRIREARNKIQILKGEKCLPEIEESRNHDDVCHLKNEERDMYSICLQVKQHLQINTHTSVVDIADRIDELVEKVISLEVTVSSQTAQIQTLRSETNELQRNLRALEEDKANLMIDSNGMNVKLSQVEDELHRVQDLEKNMHDGNGILQTQFIEACSSLNNISEKLQLKDSNSSFSAQKNEEEEGKEKGEVHIDRDIEVKLLSNEASSQFVDVSEKPKVELNGTVSSSLESNDLDDDGREDRQKMLLYEYTSVLRNYKDTKKRMLEMEKQNQEYQFEMTTQIQELKSANAVKDQEIRALRRKLFSHSPSNDVASSVEIITAKPNSPFEITDNEVDQHHVNLLIEEKFRAELDTLLEEKIDFWLRFSTSYHQIQKFETSFKEMKAELEKLKESIKESGSGSASPKHSLKQETRTSTPIDKKLRELNTELQVWLEQNGLLKGELQCRLTSLCNIQEEISKVSRDNEGEDSRFDPYQGAKFQGELLNMQKENNKVSKELQTGLDHVKEIQSEVAKALSKLRENFDMSRSDGYWQHRNFRHLTTKSKVPLRTFLFGEKRKKASIFSCMSPALNRYHSPMKSGFPT